MKRRHYDGTTVSEASSLLDIERLLRQHGVQTIRWTSGPDALLIEFTWPYQSTELGFRMNLNIPTELDGYELTPPQREKERRRRLRVLLNHVKAKLIAVEEGLVTLEQEFLPYLIGPGGQTLGEVAAVQITSAIKSGEMPQVKLLPEGRG